MRTDQGLCCVNWTGWTLLGAVLHAQKSVGVQKSCCKSCKKCNRTENELAKNASQEKIEILEKKYPSLIGVKKWHPIKLGERQLEKKRWVSPGEACLKVTSCTGTFTTASSLERAIPKVS
jgi:hypothetical protein